MNDFYFQSVFASEKTENKREESYANKGNAKLNKNQTQIRLIQRVVTKINSQFMLKFV